MSLLKRSTCCNLLPSNGTNTESGITSSDSPQVEKTEGEEWRVSRGAI